MISYGVSVYPQKIGEAYDAFDAAIDVAHSRFLLTMRSLDDLFADDVSTATEAWADVARNLQA